ncbi:hypothetical protein XELAEV_18012384mg [Xenopus laevis]|uniref:Uncharacterized protein n=1 Tax=Xenopus laevis TaxID=8355 RepID=A0A974HY31_XENLA|nr:hypothetical protein XELAEV_18012384mg [Xenopus laevis]
MPPGLVKKLVHYLNLSLTLHYFFCRIHNAIFPSQSVFILPLLHVMSALLHGLVNDFVFGQYKETLGLLNITLLQLAFQSRFCNSKRIRENHSANVHFMAQIDEEDPESCADDTTVLFSMPSITLRDKGP